MLRRVCDGLRLLPRPIYCLCGVSGGRGVKDGLERT